MPQYNVRATISLEVQAQVKAADEQTARALAQELEFADWDILDASTEIEEVTEEPRHEDGHQPG